MKFLYKKNAMIKLQTSRLKIDFILSENLVNKGMTKGIMIEYINQIDPIKMLIMTVKIKAPIALSVSVSSIACCACKSIFLMKITDKPKRTININADNTLILKQTKLLNLMKFLFISNKFSPFSKKHFIPSI